MKKWISSDPLFNCGSNGWLWFATMVHGLSVGKADYFLVPASKHHTTDRTFMYQPTVVRDYSYICMTL